MFMKGKTLFLSFLIMSVPALAEPIKGQKNDKKIVLNEIKLKNSEKRRCYLKHVST